MIQFNNNTKIILFNQHIEIDQQFVRENGEIFLNSVDIYVNELQEFIDKLIIVKNDYDKRNHK